MAQNDDEGFSNLDGSPDDDEGLAPGKTTAANGDDEAMDEGFEDLLSASDDIVLKDPMPGMEETDPAQADAQAEGDEDPDDDSKLSENIKRRLQRERRVGEWEAEQRVRSELSTEIERLARENEELKTRSAPVAGQQAPTAGAEHPALVALRDQLKKAKEERRKAKIEGDVDAEETADEQVRDLDFKVRVAEHAIAAQRQQQQARPAAQGQQAPKQQQPQSRQQPAARTPHANAVAWTKANEGWFGKPGFEEATAKAGEIDRDLWSKGYRPEDPDYFTELDRRLRKAGVRKPGEQQARSTGSQGANLAPASGGSSAVRRTSSDGGNGRAGARLSSFQVQMMRNLRLDPNNKEHVRSYLRGG